MLRPGGRLALTTPAHSRATGIDVVVRGFERHFDPLSPHIRFFTRRSLARLLDEMGFDVGVDPARVGHPARARRPADAGADRHQLRARGPSGSAVYIERLVRGAARGGAVEVVEASPRRRRRAGPAQPPAQRR